MKFYTLAVETVVKETKDCIAVTFAVPDKWKEEFRFMQGQNVTIRKTMDGEEIRRSYSICSSAKDQQLRIAIKKVEGGKFSTWANDHLKPGDTLDLMPPTGRFFTPLDAQSTQKDYVAVAAGSGITPILSIIKTTLETEPNARFILLYGNKNRRDIIFKEELEGLKNKFISRFTLHYFLSRESSDFDWLQGRIDGNKIALMLNKGLLPSAVAEWFLCGPEEMIHSVRDCLLRHQVEAKKIHFELFGTKTSVQKAKESNSSIADSPSSDGSKIQQETFGNPTFNSPSKEANSEIESVSSMTKVSVRSDGKEFSFSLRQNTLNLLDAAIEQGLDLPYSCKAGVCCTCRAKLTSGSVEMLENYALEEEEIKAGFILACQALPTSQEVSISFDER
jgi:ring-1,2-phenylacetyl-CoA epoxidase subunit PaaE